MDDQTCLMDKDNCTKFKMDGNDLDFQAYLALWLSTSYTKCWMLCLIRCSDKTLNFSCSLRVLIVYYNEPTNHS